MLTRQTSQLANELAKIDAALRHKSQSDLEKLGRRIGRWLGKDPAAAKVIAVEVLRDDNPLGVKPAWCQARSEPAIGSRLVSGSI